MAWGAWESINHLSKQLECNLSFHCFDQIKKNNAVKFWFNEVTSQYPKLNWRWFCISLNLKLDLYCTESVLVEFDQSGTNAAWATATITSLASKWKLKYNYKYKSRKNMSLCSKWNSSTEFPVQLWFSNKGAFLSDPQGTDLTLSSSFFFFSSIFFFLP